MKVTDPDYYLPVVDALNPFDLFKYGTTAPLAVWGVDSNSGERSRYVVKFKNSGRMSPASSAFELIASWMAMELGLPAVEPALINISPEFIELTMKGRDGYRNAAQSQGINFGSKYVEGYTDIPIPVILPATDLLETAKMIYVFDLFIANTDRGHQRPNVLSNGSQLLIFDHELAFSFLQILPFMRNPTPWLLNDADRDLYRNHIFYQLLKDLIPDLSPQVKKLACFGASFWDKVIEKLPAEWKSEMVLEIIPYLTSIVNNRDYFAKSLNKTFTE